MGEREGGGSGGIYAASQREAAEVLGVAAETLCRWHDAPRNGDRSYSLPVLVKWYLGRELDRAAREAEVSDPDAALTAYRIARTKLADLELEQRRGNLVRIDVVNRRLGELLQAFRGGLEGLPNVLATQLEGLERAAIHEVLRGRVGQALEGLREGLLRMSAELSPGSTSPEALEASSPAGSDRSVAAELGEDERDGVALEAAPRPRRKRPGKKPAAVVSKKGKAIAVAAEPKKASRKTRSAKSKGARSGAKRRKGK